MFSKVIKYFWGLTAVLSLGLGIYKVFFTESTGFKQFMPFIIFAFCIVVFLSLSNQVAFKDKLDKNK